MGALDALAASERSRGHHTFRRRRHRALRRGGHPLLVTGTRAAALRLPLPLRLVLLAGKRRGNRVPGIAAQLGDRVAGAGLGADAARHCALGLAQLHLAGQADARRVHYPDVAREVDGPIDPPPAQVAGAHVGPAHEGPGIDRGRRVAASHRPATVATVVDERGPIAIAEGAPTYVARTDRPRHPRRPPSRGGNPVPAETSRVAPPAVVERGPTPAFIGHPRPAIGRPDPPAVRIGLPAGSDAGAPHVADLGFVVPGAVGLQLAGVRCDLFGKVFRPGVGPLVALAPLFVPAGELVAGCTVEALGSLCRFPASRVGALARAHARGIEVGLAFVYREPGLARVDVDAVDAAPADLDHPARRLDAHAGVAPMDVEPARPQPQDDEVLPFARYVVELASAVDPDDRALGELDFGPPPLIRPHAIAGKEWKVRQRLLGPRL